MCAHLLLCSAAVSSTASLQNWSLISGFEHCEAYGLQHGGFILRLVLLLLVLEWSVLRELDRLETHCRDFRGLYNTRLCGC